MNSNLDTLSLISIVLIALGSSSIASAACTRVDADFTIAPGVKITHEALCGSSATAVGGGFSLGSNSQIIHATLPKSSMNGWTAEVENSDMFADHGLKVSAICCAEPVCSRVDADFTIAPGVKITHEVLCGSSERAVGGGFSLGSNSQIIHASLPTSSMNGWAAEVENSDMSASHGLKVSAVCCAEPFPLHLECTRVDADFTIAPGTKLIREMKCASGYETGGGGFSLGSNNLVVHASLPPTSSLNGWSAEVENTGSATHGFKVSHACCETLPVELQLFSIE